MSKFGATRNAAIPVNEAGWYLSKQSGLLTSPWRAGYTGKLYPHTGRYFKSEKLAATWLQNKAKEYADQFGPNDICQQFLCRSWVTWPAKAQGTSSA